MIPQLMKSLSLNAIGSGEMILLVACLVLLAAVVGYYADYIAPGAGFGVIGNGVTLFVSLWAGLIAYVHFVQPLKYAGLPTVLAVAVGSAVLGLLAAAIVFRSPARA